MRRREFVAAAVAAGLGCGLQAAPAAEGNPQQFPTRVITSGPRYHWFGYYDKLQFDPTNRYVLSNEVAFEHRTPTADDAIRVGMVDLENGDRWIELGESRAWGWQQGCMLQWRPGHGREVIWNDRKGDQFVSHVLNVVTDEHRVLPAPVYTLSSDGSFGLTADFARIQVMRPGYGYVGLPDKFGDQLAPQDSGVFKVDLATGKTSLVLPLAEVAKIPYHGQQLENVWHYFNHLLISPDDQRFIVLHRWRKRDANTGEPTGGFTTRMFTANIDGSDLFVLDPSGYTSHFIWRDPEHICMWTRPEGKPEAFYLYTDKTRVIEPVGAGVMTRNGHNTYLPETNSEWILNDTYPDKDRIQRPYLYHVPTGKQVWLGEFPSPKVYTGEWRCDTHPRSSNDGTKVCIDSPHAGGRQLYLIDISQLVKG
ncbi:MAG: hypothetical protein KDA66_04830 [Planctomycetaceae bacterium]|nr:hypothetical protein [Planctomycetaceae bacterium]